MQPFLRLWRHNGANAIVRTRFHVLLAFALALGFGTVLSHTAQAQTTNVITYHNDIARTGQNTSETILTQANVNVKTFGKVFSYPVDGWVYAQPLIVSQVRIPNKGTHNVLIVATEHNSVYGFDADSNTGPNVRPLWHVNLGPSAPTPNNDFGNRYGPYRNLQPEIGITGTPYIDTRSGVLYVVAFTKENGQYFHKVHALSVRTGQEMPNSPVVVQATVPGTGDGSVNGQLTFTPQQQAQRPGLLVLNGTLYVGFGSYADTDPYHGWLMAFNATTLALKSVWVSTPNGGEGAIWQSGDGPAADSAGNLYFETGNGSFDATNQNFADSIVKIKTTGGLTLADYFTPHDQDYLAAADLDLGSGGMLLLPDSVGSRTHPHLLVGIGKNGSIYLVDRDQMGGFHAGDDSQIVQSLAGVIGGAWSMPAYWNNRLYFGGSGDSLKCYTLYKGQLSPVPASQTTTNFAWPGPTPSISSNGSANGIVWVVENNNAQGEDDPGQAILHAYSASNLTHEFYNSTQAPGRDTPGKHVKFVTPTIANGKVYIGTQYEVDVYGLGKFIPAPTITPNGGQFTRATRVAIAEATPGAQIYYTTDGSTPTTSSTLYTGPVVLNDCAQVSAKAYVSGFVPSATAQASFVIDRGPRQGTGLWGTYFSNTNLDPTTGTTVTRVDPSINFNWNGNSPVNGIGGSNWSARWVGQIQSQCTGKFTFSTISDDGVRVWVNGQQIINDWTNHAPTLDSGTIAMTRDQKVTIKIEYFQGGGGSMLQLYWSCNGITQSVVPQTQLYPTH